MSVLDKIEPNWTLMKSPFNYAIVFLMVALGLFIIDAVATAISRA